MRRLAAILGLIAALVGPPAQAQDDDRGILQSFLEDNLSDAGRQVRIIGFEGALSGRATVDELSIADAEGVWLTIRDAVFDWNRSALLRGRLEISELSAGQILLPRAPVPADDLPPPEASPLALPELPVSIDIGTLRVGELDIGEPLFGVAAKFTLDGSATLEGGAGEADLSVTRLDGPEGILRFNGSYSNATRVLGLTLNLTEAADGITANLIGLPGRPSVELDLTGTGPVSNYTAQLTLATDGETRLTGNFTTADLPDPDTADAAARGFTVDVSGDLRPLVEPKHRAFLGPEVSLATSGTRFADGRLAIATLSLRSRALTLSGAADILADGWPQRLSLEGRIEPGEDVDVLLTLPGPETRIAGAVLSLSYDAERGEAWTFDTTVDGLKQADLSISSARLAGSGTLSPRDKRVNGALNLSLVGIAPDDPALAEAIGPVLSGRTRFGYASGTPLQLSEIDFSGEDYSLTGEASIEGVEGQVDLAIAGDLLLSADDLGRFAGITGQSLAGGAALGLNGSIAPVAGAFDLEILGTTRDLAVGLDQVDPLLAGATRLDAAVRRDTGGLFLRSLTITGDRADISANGRLTTGDSNLAFDVALDNLELALPGFFGNATLKGTAVQTGDQWTFSADATAPGQTTATIEGSATLIDGAAGPVSGAAALRIGQLSDYSQIAGRPLSGALALTLTASGDLRDDSLGATLDGTGRSLGVGLEQLDPLLAGDMRFFGAVRRDGGGLFIESLSVRGERANLTAKGRVTPGDSDVTLDVSLAELQTVLPNASGAATLSGRARQDGNDWTLSADATGPGRTTASVEGKTTLIDGAPGPLNGAAVIDVGDLSVYSRLAGRTLGGGLSLTLTASGNLRENDLSATLDGTARSLRGGLPQLDPLLEGETRVFGSVRRDGESIFIDSVSVTGERANLQAKGRITPGDSLVTLDAKLDELETVLTGASGSASLTGRAVQDGPDWTVEASLNAPGGTTAEIGGTATLIDGSPGPVAGLVTLSVGDLSAFAGLAGRRIGGALDLTASAAGDLRDGTLTASADGTGRNLVTGVAEADLLLRGASTFTMDLRRTPEEILVFDRFELRTPQLIADLTGSFGPERSRVRYSLDLANLGLFVPNLSGPVSAEGVVSAADGPYSITSALRGPGGTTASLDGTLARDASRANLSVSGSGPLALGNRFIAPNLVDGTARFDLGLNGPLAVTSLSGTIQTGGARLTVPALRTSLADINAEIRLGGGSANLSATASVSTGGRVSLAGRAGLTPPFNGDLTATLSNVGVRQAGIYETTVDGRLAVSGPLGGGAALTGDLALGATEIRIPEGAGSGGGAIEGLVHLNEPPAVRQTRARAGLIDTGGNGGPGAEYPLNVVVRAPARIFIRGRGLDAELGGELRLSGTTSDVVTEGRFDLIRGRLDILGKRLLLTEAFAQLQGDFDPYIRAVASTESGDTTIQIIVEGLASAPTVTFASNPDLPEDEILARLLFGRDLSQISALQALQLANAVRVLAGGGGEGIVGRLRQNFGLDDLDVAAGEDGAAGVRVGKYINDRLYTDVTVDTSGRSEINLNLTITPSITARGTASSDGNTGIGIFFERDY